MKKYLLILKHIIDIISISVKDGFEFVKFTELLHIKEDEINRIQFELTVGVHSLEKGLSFRNKKKGFGEAKAMKQLATLLNYLKKGYPYNNYAVLETIAIIKAYLTYKQSVGETNSKIEQLYQQCLHFIANISDNYCDAGVDIIKKEVLTCQNKEAIQSLFKNTRSIRNYDKSIAVTEDEIKSAISLSRMAPSACNRQPVKVYYTMDFKKNEEISKLVPGNRGFENEIPNFLVVTSAKNFFDLFEYNQWFVNGGIFLSYLRLALHTVNIGSCIFQWALRSDEKALRTLCTIPENEAIIAIVGIGHYAEESYCIKAQRKSVDEYISKF